MIEMTQHYPATATQVANEFIGLGLCEPNVPKIDQMKLQKLLFYSQGWYLAYNDAPLFEENFEAWTHGSVIRDIYSQTAEYGREKVSDKLSELGIAENGSFSFITPNGVGDNLKEFIKNVWDTHKSFTGIQLSNATHAPGEPWTIIKEMYGSLDAKPLIPTPLIQTVFKKKLYNDDTE